MQQIHQQFRSEQTTEEQNSEKIESHEDTNKPRTNHTVMYTKKTSPYLEITEIKETQIETVTPTNNETQKDKTTPKNNKRVKFNKDVTNHPEDKN